MDTTGPEIINFILEEDKGANEFYPKKVFKSNETGRLIIEFNEPIQITSGLTMNNFITITLDSGGSGGTLTPFTSDDDKKWTSTFTPTSGIDNKDCEIKFVHTDIQDKYGNGNSISQTIDNITIDTSGPTVESFEISDPTLGKGQRVRITIVFSKPVSAYGNSESTGKPITRADNLALSSDLHGVFKNINHITDGSEFTVSNDRKKYEIDFIPNDDITEIGHIYLTGTYTDESGNQGPVYSASDPLSFVNYDISSTLPTISISSDNVQNLDTTTQHSIDLTFTCSKEMDTFSNNDVTFTNGILGALTTTDQTIYTGTFTTAENSVKICTINIAGGATATVIIDTNPINTSTYGTVTGISLDTSGSGYMVAPAVTISGGGATVQATASVTIEEDKTNVNFGKITRITLNTPGSGYTSTPIVTIGSVKDTYNNVNASSLNTFSWYYERPIASSYIGKKVRVLEKDDQYKFWHIDTGETWEGSNSNNNKYLLSTGTLGRLHTLKELISGDNYKLDGVVWEDVEASPSTFRFEVNSSNRIVIHIDGTNNILVPTFDFGVPQERQGRSFERIQFNDQNWSNIEFGTTAPSDADLKIVLNDGIGEIPVKKGTSWAVWNFQSLNTNPGTYFKITGSTININGFNDDTKLYFPKPNSDGKYTYDGVSYDKPYDTEESSWFLLDLSKLESPTFGTEYKFNIYVESLDGDENPYVPFVSAQAIPDTYKDKSWAWWNMDHFDNSSLGYFVNPNDTNKNDGIMLLKHNNRVLNRTLFDNTGSSNSTAYSRNPNDIAIIVTGFLSVPTITIDAPSTAGTRATATATLTSGGSNYTIAPTVSIGAPSFGTQATAIAEIGGGNIIKIRITNGGSGYTTAPTVTITPASGDIGGSGANAIAIIDIDEISNLGQLIEIRVTNNELHSISVINEGSGYDSAPNVTISGNTSASAYAVLTDGSISSIVIMSRGPIIYLDDNGSNSSNVSGAQYWVSNAKYIGSIDRRLKWQETDENNQKYKFEYPQNHPDDEGFGNTFDKWTSRIQLMDYNATRVDIITDNPVKGSIETLDNIKTEPQNIKINQDLSTILKQGDWIGRNDFEKFNTIESIDGNTITLMPHTTYSNFDTNFINIDSEEEGRKPLLIKCTGTLPHQKVKFEGNLLTKLSGENNKIYSHELEKRDGAIYYTYKPYVVEVNSYDDIDTLVTFTEDVTGKFDEGEYYGIPYYAGYYKFIKGDDPYNSSKRVFYKFKKYLKDGANDIKTAAIFDRTLSVPDLDWSGNPTWDSNDDEEENMQLYSVYSPYYDYFISGPPGW